MTKRAHNYVKDRSKSNTIFSDFTENRQSLNEEAANLTDDSSAVFDESCMKLSACQSCVLRTASLKAMKAGPWALANPSLYKPSIAWFRWSKTKI